MFSLLSELSLYGTIGFIVTILIDSLIVKVFLKEKTVKFSKIFSEISFVKIPTILVAMILGGILGFFLGLIVDSVNLGINQFYFPLLSFVLVYVYMYNIFLTSAISNLNSSINNSKKNYYIISVLSLIITILMNLFIKIGLPMLGL